MATNPESPYRPPLDEDSSVKARVGRIVLEVALASVQVLLVFIVMFVGPFAWLLRDGLGPDSIPSSGLNAFVRMFWFFYWGPCSITLASLLVLILWFRRRARR